MNTNTKTKMASLKSAEDPRKEEGKCEHEYGRTYEYIEVGFWKK